MPPSKLLNPIHSFYQWPTNFSISLILNAFNLNCVYIGTHLLLYILLCGNMGSVKSEYFSHPWILKNSPPSEPWLWGYINKMRTIKNTDVGHLWPLTLRWTISDLWHWGGPSLASEHTLYWAVLRVYLAGVFSSQWRMCHCCKNTQGWTYVL